MSDYAPIIFLTLTLGCFIPAAITPFAQRDNARITFFEACSKGTLSGEWTCNRLTPEYDGYACVTDRDLFIAGQATVIITCCFCFFAMIPALFKAMDKAIDINGSIHFIIYVLMDIFAAIFMALAFAMFYGKICGNDNNKSRSEQDFNIGPCPPLCVPGFVFALISTYAARNQFYYGSC